MPFLQRSRRRSRRRRTYDYLIFFSVVFLVMIGLVMLASASSNLGKIRFDDSYYYLKHQIIFGLSLGILGFLIGSRIYYRYYEKISLLLLIISITLLALVFTPLGFSAGGADRWLQIGSISFQPSELLKLTFIIYLAAWLGRKKERITSTIKGLLPFIIIVGLVTFMLLKQPSTTSAAIFVAVAFIMYFASGAKPIYILGLALAGLLIFSSVIYLSPYRWERIQSFLNPGENLQTSGYQINQTLIAIGSGGLWGTGYGQSNTKIHYLPEPIGDSIFAVIAEELGFVGVLALFALFSVLIMRTFFIAAKVRDKFGQLMLIGFGSLIAIQVFINIAAVSGVIPLTGTPLPFISFGGTALATFMTITGVINNVSRYH